MTTWNLKKWGKFVRYCREVVITEFDCSRSENELRIRRVNFKGQKANVSLKDEEGLVNKSHSRCLSL